jgi:hypothetical protein
MFNLSVLGATVMPFGHVFGPQLIAKSFVTSRSEAIARWDSRKCKGFALKGKVLSIRFAAAELMTMGTLP